MIDVGKLYEYYEWKGSEHGNNINGFEFMHITYNQDDYIDGTPKDLCEGCCTDLMDWFDKFNVKKEEKVEEVKEESNENDFDLWEMLYCGYPEAKSVLDKMENIIDETGLCLVSDYYKLSGKELIDPINYNYGWTDLKNVVIDIKFNDFYYIKDLPKPKFLGTEMKGE